MPAHFCQRTCLRSHTTAPITLKDDPVTAPISHALARCARATTAPRHYTHQLPIQVLDNFILRRLRFEAERKRFRRAIRVLQAYACESHMAWAACLPARLGHYLRCVSAHTRPTRCRLAYHTARARRDLAEFPSLLLHLEIIHQYGPIC